MIKKRFMRESFFRSNSLFSSLSDRDVFNRDNFGNNLEIRKEIPPVRNEMRYLGAIVSLEVSGHGFRGFPRSRFPFRDAREIDLATAAILRTFLRREIILSL